MLIEVRAHGFELSEAILQHVEWRVESWLGWAAGQVAGVMVRLEDINGPHGGVDKCCRISLRLRAARTLVVEGRDRDLYRAVDLGVARLKEAAARHVARQHTIQRPRIPQRSLRVQW